jgi:hypothetical protein
MRKATFADIFGTTHEKCYDKKTPGKIQANQEEYGPKKFIKP